MGARFHLLDAGGSPGTVAACLAIAFAVMGGLIVLTTKLVHHAPILLTGLLFLGAGMGAFIDGITLHQVLQWHAMVSTPLPPTDLVSSKVNMFWGGVFTR